MTSRKKNIAGSASRTLLPPLPLQDTTLSFGNLTGINTSYRYEIAVKSILKY